MGAACHALTERYASWCPRRRLGGSEPLHRLRREHLQRWFSTCSIDGHRATHGWWPTRCWAAWRPASPSITATRSPTRPVRSPRRGAVPDAHAAALRRRARCPAIYAAQPRPPQALRLQDRERTRALDPTWFDAFSANCCMQARRRSVRRTGRRLVVEQTGRFQFATLVHLGADALLGTRRPHGADRHRRATPGPSPAGLHSSRAPPTHPTSSNPPGFSTPWTTRWPLPGPMAAVPGGQSAGKQPGTGEPNGSGAKSIVPAVAHRG